MVIHGRAPEGCKDELWVSQAVRKLLRLAGVQDFGKKLFFVGKPEQLARPAQRDVPGLGSQAELIGTRFGWCEGEHSAHAVNAVVLPVELVIDEGVKVSPECGVEAAGVHCGA